MDSFTGAILGYRFYVELLAIAIALITAISSVDDVFVDIYYWCMKIFGQNAKDKEFARLVKEANLLPERPFAIMVATWREHEVIFSMLATNSRLIAYKNYHFFVGVYRNDQPTIDEVREAQRSYPNVHMAVVPRDGPTSKADCLNVVLAEIRNYEIETGVPFAGVALHDAEDFIHPHELQVFNWAVGTYDFVQLPVFSFNQPFRDVVGGIYMDEFAEVHTKDLTVRRHLSGLVPCAGVSACFSHTAIAKLADTNSGEVFRTSCFTEDYDIAFRLRALGLKSTFLSCPINYTIDMRANKDDKKSSSPTFVERSMPIATREFFPSNMRAAYRQRARWLIGIVFQGTSTHGWHGDWGTRYFLARDRKGILTGPVVMLGYFVLMNLLMIGLYLTHFYSEQSFDYVLLSHDAVMNLFYVNMAFLVWRLLHRMMFTTKIYDFGHGLISAPRLIVSNFVNFFAVMRAVRLYSSHLRTGSPLVWDKTDHSYPFAFGREVPAKPDSVESPAPVGIAAIAAPALLVVFACTTFFSADCAHAQSNSGHQLSAAEAEKPAGGADSEIRAARAAVNADPASEPSVRALVAVLSLAGQKAEALAEADRFAARSTPSALLLAQRGFLRRELGNVKGSAEDFAAARIGDGLSPEQKLNVEAGLSEAKSTELQSELASVQAVLRQGDFERAASISKSYLQKAPKSELAISVRADALSGSGRKREALAELDAFFAQGSSNSALHAQRGFLRRELKNMQGAKDDFTSALSRNEIDADSRKVIQAALAETSGAERDTDIARAQEKLNQRDFTGAIAQSRAILQREPISEAATRIHVAALSRSGRKREGLAELNRYDFRDGSASALRAERGYLRRELQDISGAIADFTAALAGNGLSSEQRQNVEAALREARATGGGRKSDSRPEASKLIAQGQGRGWMFAARGYTRRDAGDLQGAVKDFDSALALNDVDARTLPSLHYARAEAVASLAQKEGRQDDAEAAFRDTVTAYPRQADGWFRLGYLYLAQGSKKRGADALRNGVEINPVGRAYVDAANAYIFHDAPLASQLYRKGLDRWYAGDKSFATASEKDLERIKNEVVEADASIRTTIAYGGISGRAESAGGNNNIFGAETVVRFDGRYLAAVPGLEAFARGLSGKDATSVTETNAGVGVRYRPIRDLNLYVGGLVDHFFTPDSRTQPVLTWGLGLGADPYPYLTGWKTHWDFSTFGAWRTVDRRVLEDTKANIGFLYEFRTPVRAAIGPTVLAVAGFDNLATTQWAAAIGPSISSYIWLGGDQYRSYDSMLFMQLGYLMKVGADARQSGWRGQIGITF